MQQYSFVIVAMVALALAAAAQAAGGDGPTSFGSVPSKRALPQPKRAYFGLATVKSAQAADGETITLSNDAVSVGLKVDSDKGIRMVSLKAENGQELLRGPAACFSVLDGQGGVVKDGSSFTIESWRPSIHASCSEVEVSLKAPERVVWRLRLCADKPYIEQRFEMPDSWRAVGNSVRQSLDIVPSLKPVMPNLVFLKGFSGGRPNLTDRARFEFVAQSDHLAFDADSSAGLATFVAGVGGEEIVVHDSVTMVDHVTPALGPSEPIARFMLWPFAGPVERGFRDVKTFIADEYLTKTLPPDRLIWTQFFTWQWVPKGPRKERKDPANDPYWRGEVTADRILDILPALAATGYEEFHLDAGWETSFADDGWHFDAERFPNGFEPIRRWLRENAMSLYMWWGISDITARQPAEVLRIIAETDLHSLFYDRGMGEETIPALREIRKSYPGLSVMNHFAPSRSKNYPQVNIHLASDLTQAYFAEEQFLQWSDVPPNEPKLEHAKRTTTAGDLVTRSLAYQANWIFPFRHVYPPAWPWAGVEDCPTDILLNRVNALTAARYRYEWGEDPRDLRKELLNVFMDSSAFYKAMRPYRVDYQHVLGVPDGIHPDGIAHMVDGKGFIFLFNPGDKSSEVSWEELFWEPDLELDPDVELNLTDWTEYVSARKLASIDLRKPSGGLKMAPLSSRIIGVNIDVDATLAEVKKQRAMMSHPL